MLAMLRLLVAFELLRAILPVAAGAAERIFAECRDDAILVFDASGSMASTDARGGGSRLHQVREAARAVVPQVAPARNLGLIVYGGGRPHGCSDISLKVVPGPDRGPVILEALRDLKANGPTPLTESVLQAANTLKYREKPATIVLLTDGEESCGGDTCKLASRLASEGRRTRVHVIDYRLRPDSDDRGTIQSSCLADVTGGRHVSVDTTQELVAALRETLLCPLITGLPEIDPHR